MQQPSKEFNAHELFSDRLKLKSFCKSFSKLWITFLHCYRLKFVLRFEEFTTRETFQESKHCCVLFPPRPVRECPDFLSLLLLLRISMQVEVWTNERRAFSSPQSSSLRGNISIWSPPAHSAPHRLRFPNVRLCHHDLMQYKREACKILLSSWQILHIWIPGQGFREVAWFVYSVKWSSSEVVLNICMGCLLLVFCYCSFYLWGWYQWLSHQLFG